MVKHNNSISNGHFRKHWQKYVKTDFNKFSKKIKRRNLRKIKYKNLKIFNFSPKNVLKPIIHNPTKKYNLKIRLGRGFSFSELHNSKIPRKQATSFGISIDKRRRGNNLRQLSNTKRLDNFFEKMHLISLKKNSKENLKGLDNIFYDLKQKKIIKHTNNENYSFPLKTRETYETDSIKVLKTLNSIE